MTQDNLLSLAKTITADLFKDGIGRDADRLVLTIDERGGVKKDLGGWCRHNATDRVFAILLQTIGSSAAEGVCIDDIRSAGWSVAVHNDYRQDGKSFTFWLFTRGSECVKGEGCTDVEALNQVRAEIARRR